MIRVIEERCRPHQFIIHKSLPRMISFAFSVALGPDRQQQQRAGGVLVLGNALR